MYLFIIGFCMLLLSCFILWYTYKYKSNIITINNDIQDKNKELELQNFTLQEQAKRLNKDVLAEKEKLDLICEQITIANQTLKNDYDNQKELAEKAYNDYCSSLDIKRKEKEKQCDDEFQNFVLEYTAEKNVLSYELKTLQKELDTMKATRAAAIEAQNKEQAIKENKEFYMLCPNAADVDDIKRLERIKPDLHNPRILSMLIWSTFFQKPMTALCNKVLGVNQVTGIYKITNQLNDMCYIGQAVDVATRWKAHAKCGLDIDTPQGNKLYKAMKEDGIWNFSWELIEKCPKDQLDEKEKFYIELYQSKNFGYNTTKGNS